tara:strand:- start:9600 stop:9989 length:390 start_codon:yes stop_codon:yes gene_type:complete
MSASTIIYGLLSTNTGVTNLVSTKIYPIEAPQTIAFPYIVFQAISNMPTNTKSGASTMDKTRIQVTIVAKKQSEIDSIGAAVRSALDFIKTPAPIQIITYEGEVDMYSYPSGQDGIFEKAQDYFLTTSR